MADHISFGKSGEDLAIAYLESLGYQILDRNWVYGQFGELDIVALKDNTLIFIEVKARKNLNYGYPVEAVTSSKLKKIERAAWGYKQNHPDTPEKMRIEVVSVLLEKEKTPKIELYRIS